MVGYFMGIDPGNLGAICVIDDKFKIKCLEDCPTCEIKTGRKKIKNFKRVDEVKTRIDNFKIYNILKKYKMKNINCIIEHAQSMPRQGVVSSFNYGEGYGKYLGVLASLNIPYFEIKPNVWKKYYGLNYDKNLSLQKAWELIPESKKYIYLKKHDGRAEALIIAVFCYCNQKLFEDLNGKDIN